MVKHSLGPRIVWIPVDLPSDQLDWRTTPSWCRVRPRAQDRGTKGPIARAVVPTEQGYDEHLRFTSEPRATPSCTWPRHTWRSWWQTSLGRRQDYWRAMIFLTVAHLLPMGTCSAHRVPRWEIQPGF